MDEQEVYDRMKEGGYTRQDVEKYLAEEHKNGRLLNDGYDKWRTSRI
jgi:predicted transcriptional regulator